MIYELFHKIFSWSATQCEVDNQTSWISSVFLASDGTIHHLIWKKVFSLRFLTNNKMTVHKSGKLFQTKSIVAYNITRLWYTNLYILTLIDLSMNLYFKMNMLIIECISWGWIGFSKVCKVPLQTIKASFEIMNYL